jgi:hypothetical protein
MDGDNKIIEFIIQNKIEVQVYLFLEEFMNLDLLGINFLMESVDLKDLNIFYCTLLRLAIFNFQIKSLYSF